MKKPSNVLALLKAKRKQNISEAKSWSDDEAAEIIATYKKAKSIAAEENDEDGVAILVEKISQVEEAILLKRRA
jgi:hypothetical protein